MLNQHANAQMQSGSMLPAIRIKHSGAQADEHDDQFERNAVTMTMENAVQRHYKDLKKLEDQKMIEKADFEWRIQAEREMAANERQRKMD
jgi:hypothetical protein